MRNYFYLIFALLFIECTNSRSVEEGAYAENGSLMINGSRLNYVIEGRGISCLVIGSSVYYPRTFSDELKENLKMTFIDMPWFSEEPADLNYDEYGLEEITADIEEARQQLKLGKTIIVGHSIHGSIAFEYAKRYPEHVSGIVMIGSPDIFSNEKYKRAMEEQWKTASPERKEKQANNWKKLAAQNKSDRQGETIREYLTMAPTYWYDPDYDAAWLWKDMVVNEKIIDHLYGTVFHNYNMFEGLDILPAPVFVAMGKYDYAVPYRLWMPYDSLYSFELELFEKSGHTPQLEESENFDNVLLTWINSTFQ